MTRASCSALEALLPLARLERGVEAVEQDAVRALCLVRDLRGVCGSCERAIREEPVNALH